MASVETPRVCAICGNPLPKRNKRFCSQACNAQSQRRIPDREVLYDLYWNQEMSCGDIAKQLGVGEPRISVLFKRYQIPLRSISQATVLAFKKNPGVIHRGEKRHTWKGGRHIGSRGYVHVWRPNHPRADHHGYVAEHLLVWEKTHGKLPPEGWIIHHLNGIKTDNRPENLVALSTTKHGHILRAKAERIRGLEAEVNKLKDALGKNQSIF